MLPSFLLKPFVAPLAIGIAVLSLCGNAWLGILHWSDGRTIGTLTTENTRLATDLGTCRANNRTLEGAVTVQNAGVDSLKTAAELAAAGAKLGQAAAEVSAASHDRRGSALDHATPGSADHCAAASALIHNTLAGEKTK